MVPYMPGELAREFPTPLTISMCIQEGVRYVTGKDPRVRIETVKSPDLLGRAAIAVTVEIEDSEPRTFTYDEDSTVQDIMTEITQMFIKLVRDQSIRRSMDETGE